MSTEQEQKAQVFAPTLHQKLWAAPLCLWGRWEAELWRSGCPSGECPSGEMSLSGVSHSQAHAQRMPGAHSLWDTMHFPALSLQEGEVRNEHEVFTSPVSSPATADCTGTLPAQDTSPEGNAEFKMHQGLI